MMQTLKDYLFAFALCVVLLAATYGAFQMFATLFG